MKRIIPIASLLMVAGCHSTDPVSHLAPLQDSSIADESLPYIVLTTPPVPLLDKMRLLHFPDHPSWPNLIDEFVANGHPILRHTIRQLEEEHQLTPESAATIYDRISHSATVAVDGQRILSLMEIACYADVECHPIEYPLRVATRDYVKANVDSNGVKEVLRWIRTSYHSGMPLDHPGDQTGDLRGLLVEAMRIRLSEYAGELLRATDVKK